MGNTTLERLIWVLIYAGLVVFGLGVWYVEHSLAVGTTLMTVGALGVAAGAGLIWLRARRL